MIEPSGTPVNVLGIPNRQSKVPGMGSDQKATRQSGFQVPQAQDDPGFGSLSHAGLADMVPGHTRRNDHCLVQGQDSGSIQKGAGASVGDSEPGGYDAKHARRQTQFGDEGMTPINIMHPPGIDAGTNGDKSVDGNSSPSGRTVTGDNAGTKDIGTSSGMLFPGIVE